MIRWAWHQWLADPARAMLTAIVFGAALALALLLEGIQVGLYSDLRAFPASLRADLVALEAGNRYLGIMPSELPQLSRAALENVPGVRSVHPVTILPIIFGTPRLRSPVQLVAYDERGGPPRLEAGRPPAREGEIVLDLRLAQRHGLAVGDAVAILDYPLTVSGLSGDSASPFTPLAFVSYDTLLDVVLSSGLPVGLDDYSLLSALLVEAAPGADVQQVRAAAARALPEADFYTPPELAAFNASFGERLLGPVLALMSAIAAAIAGLTMALLRYADVQAQFRQFGIQKALGATPGQLAAALVAGSAFVALASVPIALALSRAMAGAVATWNPTYHALVWDSSVLGRGLALGLAAAIVGGLWPMRRLAQLDALVVFQR